MSYNQKINFSKYDWKSYLLCHINITIAHKNLILLKQRFSHVEFSQQRVETNPEGGNDCIVSVDIYWKSSIIAQPLSCCLGMIMSHQHTALLLQKNANETESSAILHQKAQSILF